MRKLYTIGFALLFTFFSASGQNNTINFIIDSAGIDACEGGTHSIYLRVKNLLNNGNTAITNVSITAINGTAANQNISSAITPALPKNLPGANNSNGLAIFTGVINCLPNAENITLRVTGMRNNVPQNNVIIIIIDQACKACKSPYFIFNTPTPSIINYAGNTISFNQGISIFTSPPKTIKNITAEITYFEMVPQNDLCLPCDKDSPLYGHFTNGTNEQVWTGPQTGLNININTPQLVDCCSALFKWCIRYKVEFTDCTVCTKTVCYTKNKTGCTGIILPNEPNN
jgi:hypothetical protein